MYMKYIKLFENFDFDEDDFDYEEELPFDIEDLRKCYITYGKDIQSIEIAKKLKSMGENIFNYDNIIKNINNDDWEKYNYMGFRKEWVRSSETNTKNSITYDKFMNI